MDKRIKIGIISGVTIIALSIGAVVFLRPSSVDKTGECREVSLTDQEYEVLKNTVYSDLCQESLDKAYKKVDNKEVGDETMDTHIQEIVYWMSNEYKYTYRQ